MKRENELISKQYNSLLRQYNKVLKAAKDNADSNEYCIQELEKKFEKVLDFCNAYDGIQPDVICILKHVKRILQTEEGGIENKPDVSL